MRYCSFMAMIATRSDGGFVLDLGTAEELFDAVATAQDVDKL
jgi:hypothetical protein